MAEMTMRQIQNLLQYLGYYEGIPDGEYGPQTREATRAFQSDFGGLAPDGVPGKLTQPALRHAVAYGMPQRQEPETVEPAPDATDEDSSAAGGSFWDEIEFFDREEFRCKCGGKYCQGFPAEPREDMVRLADDARRHFGKAGHVISGLRCETWNQIQGGVYNSQHMYGEACDLRIDDVSADQLLAYFQGRAGVRYAYKINGTNVHFDVPQGKR